jgi:hypothetical protein
MIPNNILIGFTLPIHFFGVPPMLTFTQGWAKLVLIALERYSVELKRLTFNFR